MPDLLIRDLDEKPHELLKAMANREGRTLQMEAKQILEIAARASDYKATQARVAEVRATFGARTLPDSAVLIGESCDA